MSFNIKTWVDRISEYPNRRRLTKEDNTQEVVTVERYEGDIATTGDKFNADTMNDLVTVFALAPPLYNSLTQ